MERKWRHNLVTALFAFAVLVAGACELRRDFGALPGRAVLGRFGQRVRTTSFVSRARDRMRWDGMPNVLGVNLGRQ